MTANYDKWGEGKVEVEGEGEKTDLWNDIP